MAFDGGGTLTDRYLWGPAVDQILADENIGADKTYWALADNQGTVRDVVDDSGALAEHTEYDSYGIGNITSGSAVSSFQFTGKFFDSATGLQWNGGNWYNPSIGRWMSQDRLFPDSGANSYEYTYNNPTSFTDSSGFAPDAPPMGSGGNSGGGFPANAPADGPNGNVVGNPNSPSPSTCPLGTSTTNPDNAGGYGGPFTWNCEQKRPGASNPANGVVGARLAGRKSAGAGLAAGLPLLLATSTGGTSDGTPECDNICPKSSNTYWRLFDCCD